MEQPNPKRRSARKKRRKQRRFIALPVALLAVSAALLLLLRIPRDALEQNPLSPSDFAVSEGYVTCTAVPTRRGVDVSQYQEEVDWQQLLDAGFDFTFIRIGYRGNTTGDLYEDDLARQHLSAAKAAGLDVGVYFYSQAISPEEAAEEAQWCLEFLGHTALDLPMVYDWEWVSREVRTADMDRETLTACAQTFCQTIEEAGYQSMLYFNSHIARDLLDLKELREYPFWFAQYRDALDWEYRVDFWQYTESGTVPGIEGKADINLMFLYE